MSSAPGDPAPGSVNAKAHIAGRVNMSKHGDDYSGRRYLPVCLDPSSEVPNVGGSVSGLSLANMLEKFNIEYILLEAHSNIAPQLGASMGLLPGGLRILDQLGCYDRVREIVGDCCYYQPSLRLFNGKILDKEKPKTFSEQLEYRCFRTGYPQIFIDRQMLLQILFDNIQSKDRVMTRKRVVRVETAENHVRVHTQDGFTYTGDIVVGADGVHSAVRKEMWRNGVESDPSSFRPDEDKVLAADSKCIFGISKRPKSLPASALQINAFFDRRNYMMLSAPGDRLYWFMFQDMDRTTGSDIPRFTTEDQVNLAKKHFDDQVTASTTFGDVYENRLQTALVSLEEHVFSRWYFRRIITIGDAAHKVHPNTAQGGNGAIETSAVLLNTLLRRLDDTSKLSEQDIEDVFAKVQTNRFARAANALEQGRHTSSISTRDTFASRIFVHYLLPWFGDRIIMWLAVKHAETGPVIERLPLPKRNGVTLPHAGIAKKPQSLKVALGFGAFGATLVAVFLYFTRGSTRAISFATLFRGHLGHL
ncbi:hypothetical protein FOXB_08551 [Fusarium oxysporum f. sp. conglutinans Fo5176]|uniref:FAD-binding domain-containing protein n=1 Tax=Fusarium oxysporum (strain Fo5176) TaxID=660025 RepID=F9FQ71_FUSOF|nr:hypothetical protein FOXB_08551 [Fusarium oxysporum f. sp. conglutinans Fo5176]